MEPLNGKKSILPLMGQANKKGPFGGSKSSPNEPKNYM